MNLHLTRTQNLHEACLKDFPSLRTINFGFLCLVIFSLNSCCTLRWWRSSAVFWWSSSPPSSSPGVTRRTSSTPASRNPQPRDFMPLHHRRCQPESEKQIFRFPLLQHEKCYLVLLGERFLSFYALLGARHYCICFTRYVRQDKSRIITAL